jgi:hypothetical protein
MFDPTGIWNFYICKAELWTKEGMQWYYIIFQVVINDWNSIAGKKFDSTRIWNFYICILKGPYCHHTL